MCVLCITGGAVMIKSCMDKQRQSEASLVKNGLQKISALRILSEHAPPLGESKSYFLGMIGYGVAIAYFVSLMKQGAISTAQAAVLPLIYLVYLVMLASGLFVPPETDAIGEEVHALECQPLAGLTLPKGASLGTTLWWAVTWPTYALRWIMIPPADSFWDPTRRLVSSISPVGLTLLWASTCGPGVYGLLQAEYVHVVTSAVLCGVALFASSGEGPAVPWFYPALTLLSKASSIFVISLIAQELTALVKTLGAVGGVPRLWMASTAISWGNSLGDLVTGLAMVSHGQVRTAFTTVFAGPLFSCLVGGGISLTLAARRNGGVVKLWGSQRGKNVFMCTLGFLATVVMLFAIMFYGQQKSLKRFSHLLFMLYGMFLGFVLYAERFDTM
eukprot:TRINITY_DN6634_c0_g4_i1.p1 TRINITY_DN6634_c0_g4~~TRINITY_DN6634_c0_g4_i1.p1  ORF type:complete len:387 (-),score=7.85 TRINITY_DN6634_c0_g4_i1:55-1215(-)